MNDLPRPMSTRTRYEPGFQRGAGGDFSVLPSQSESRGLQIGLGVVKCAADPRRSVGCGQSQRPWDAEGDGVGYVEAELPDALGQAEVLVPLSEHGLEVVEGRAVLGQALCCRGR